MVDTGPTSLKARKLQRCRVILGNLCLALSTAYGLMDVNKIAADADYSLVVQEYQTTINVYHQILTEQCTQAHLGLSLGHSGEALCDWPLHICQAHLADQMLFFYKQTGEPYGVTKLQVTEHMNHEVKAAGHMRVSTGMCYSYLRVIFTHVSVMLCCRCVAV